MEPVVAFLRGQGLTDKQVASVIVDHPPTLSYSIPDRLQPFVDCLTDVGVNDVARVRSCSAEYMAGCCIHYPGIRYPAATQS